MIYFIKTEFGHVKIGWSNNVERRLKEIAVSNPYKFTIIKCLDWERDQEYWIHLKFSRFKFRNKREWYNLTKEIEEFLENPQKIKFNVNLYECSREEFNKAIIDIIL